jgi:hypothetical protein
MDILLQQIEQKKQINMELNNKIYELQNDLKGISKERQAKDPRLRQIINYRKEIKKNQGIITNLNKKVKKMEESERVAGPKSSFAREEVSLGGPEQRLEEGLKRFEPRYDVSPQELDEFMNSKSENPIENSYEPEGKDELGGPETLASRQSEFSGDELGGPSLLSSEQESLAGEEAEALRLAEEVRLASERVEALRLAAEQAEVERREAETSEEARLASERAEEAEVERKVAEEAEQRKRQKLEDIKRELLANSGDKKSLFGNTSDIDESNNELEKKLEEEERQREAKRIADEEIAKRKAVQIKRLNDKKILAANKAKKLAEEVEEDIQREDERKKNETTNRKKSQPNNKTKKNKQKEIQMKQMSGPSEDISTPEFEKLMLPTKGTTKVPIEAGFRTTLRKTKKIVKPINANPNIICKAILKSGNNQTRKKYYLPSQFPNLTKLKSNT